MSLYKQQEFIIRLCLEKDLRELFFASTKISSSLKKLTGISKPFNENGIKHQAEAVYFLLLNDIKTNLSHLKLKPSKFDGLYVQYTRIFPYRLENKFEDYIRFLGFLLYTLPFFNTDSKLIDRIKYEYSVFAATLKRERLFSVLENIPNSPKTNTLLVNPTLVLLVSTSSSKQFAFYYKELETDVTVMEVNKNLYNFLSVNMDKLTKKSVVDVPKSISSNTVDQLLSEGLLVYLPS